MTPEKSFPIHYQVLNTDCEETGLGLVSTESTTESWPGTLPGSDHLGALFPAPGQVWGGTW